VLEALLKPDSGTAGAALPRRVYDVLADGPETGACMLTAKVAIAADDAGADDKTLWCIDSKTRRALQKCVWIYRPEQQ